jgi:hypothetical protein
MSLAQPIMSVLCEFESTFSQPPWSKRQVLLIGTLLARGRRTVTAALRQMGLREAANFSLYHHVLNRALVRVGVESPRTTAVGADLCRHGRHPHLRHRRFGIDATLERRGGRRISKRGPYRDPLASSQQRSVATSGLWWIVLTLVITPPWTQQPWALPVLSVPAPTPEVGRRLGRRHKTVPHRVRQMLLAVRRWRPGVELTVIGDQMYSVHELGGARARRGVHLVAPRRLDAALYEPVPPRAPGTNGRPRVKGKRLPQLKAGAQGGPHPMAAQTCALGQQPLPGAGSDQQHRGLVSHWPAGAAHPLGARARSHRPPGSMRLRLDLYPQSATCGCATVHPTLEH